MLANLQNIIIKVVKTAPGIGPGPVADAIGRDKSQARRAMRDLAARGYLIEQNNGHGYAYFPVSEKDMPQAAPNMHVRLRATGQEPIEDAVFREVSPSTPTPPNSISQPTGVTAGSPSTNLVVSQPFDSRLDKAVREHARAKARAERAAQGRRISGDDAARWDPKAGANGPRLRAERLGGQFVQTMDQLYALDPSGERTRAALERAEIAAERDAFAAEQAEAARAAAARAQTSREPTNAELLGALGMAAIKAFAAYDASARERECNQAADLTISTPPSTVLACPVL